MKFLETFCNLDHNSSELENTPDTADPVATTIAPKKTYRINLMISRVYDTNVYYVDVTGLLIIIHY